MSHIVRRLTAAIACVAVSTLAVPLTHTQSTAEVNMVASASNGSGTDSGGDGGFGDFMDNYVQGRNVMVLDWFYVRPMNSTMPLTTTTGALGLGIHQSPGTDVKVSSANTLSLTSAYFFNDNIVGTFAGGVPSKFNLYGSGDVIASVPVVGPLTLVDLGLSQNNLVTTVCKRSPAIVVQYYFSTKEGKLRPFVGAGASYNFFTNLKPNQNFVSGLQNLGQVLQLDVGQVPASPAKMMAEMSSLWASVTGVGVSYESAKSWTAIGTVSYLPLEMTSTITIRSQQGQVLAVSEADVKVNPIVFDLAVGHKF